MNVIYMDSGTTNTRAYLIAGGKPISARSAPVGTRQSSMAGDNTVLLRGLKELYDRLLQENHLTDRDIDEIWMSGMVTNNWGIVDVEHMSLPLDAAKAAAESYVHFEDRFFGRELHLIRGAKTTAPGASISLDELEYVGNVRGEEIEVLGLIGAQKDTDTFLAVMPGSHTHVCYVRNGQFCDILSCFTGELHAAVMAETILSGELTHKDIPMQRENVMRGYTYLKRYGFVRALYIMHASKVFDVCSNDVRTQMVSGVLAGGVADLTARKTADEWRDAEKVVVVGKKNHIDAYTQLFAHVLSLPVEKVSDIDGMDFALAGFLEILKAQAEKKRPD